LELHLEKLSSVELKNLVKAVEAERKRRSSRSPDNHDAPVWAIPTTATVNGQGQQTK